MQVTGCTWGTDGSSRNGRVAHIFRFGRTLCVRRFAVVKTIKELDPDKQVMLGPADCMNCVRVFNALLCLPEDGGVGERVAADRRDRAGDGVPGQAGA